MMHLVWGKEGTEIGWKEFFAEIKLHMDKMWY
jgi:hypothetical protein